MKSIHHFFQRIGGLPHGRYDQQYLFTWKLTKDFSYILYSFHIVDRSAAEFEDLHNYYFEGSKDRHGICIIALCTSGAICISPSSNPYSHHIWRSALPSGYSNILPGRRPPWLYDAGYRY